MMERVRGAALALVVVGAGLAPVGCAGLPARLSNATFPAAAAHPGCTPPEYCRVVAWPARVDAKDVPTGLQLSLPLAVAEKLKSGVVSVEYRGAWLATMHDGERVWWGWPGGGGLQGSGAVGSSLCVCSGQVDGAGAGVDCSDVDSGGLWCYTQHGVCFDGAVSSDLPAADKSYAACGLRQRRAVSDELSPPAFAEALKTAVGNVHGDLPGFGYDGATGWAVLTAAGKVLTWGSADGSVCDRLSHEVLPVSRSRSS